VLIYMAIYLFMNVGTWAVILCMRQKGQMLEGIADLSGLGRSQPGLALALAIFMFAMAGVPPTAGFFAKLYIFLAAIDAKLVGLAVIGVVTSVVGSFYYLRIVKVMYFDEPLGVFDRPIAVELKWVLVVTAVATMFFILLPDPVVGSAEAAAAALFAR
jgi:NADH-quinone oxidoreductase subunit N